MNANETMCRIAKIVRWVGIIAVLPILFVGGLMISYEVGNVYAIGAATVAVAAFFYFCSWTVAWLIEGVGKEKPRTGGDAS